MHLLGCPSYLSCSLHNPVVQFLYRLLYIQQLVLRSTVCYFSRNYLERFCILHWMRAAACVAINYCVYRALLLRCRFLGFTTVTLAQSTGSTSILDCWAADPTVQILLIYKWQNTWRFNDWRLQVCNNSALHWRAQLLRLSGNPEVESWPRGSRTPRIFGQWPAIPGWASIWAVPSPATIWVVYASYSAHQPFAIQALRDTNS